MDDNLVEQKSDIAFKLLEEVKDLVKKQGILYLEIGKRFKTLRDEELFKPLGYDTWTSFINSGDLPYKKSMIYGYIDVYELFIERYKLEYEQVIDIPFDKLYMILPKAKRASNTIEVKELVSMARSLSRSDLGIELGEVIINGRAKTILVKAFLCDDCNKYRLDIDALNICKC